MRYACVKPCVFVLLLIFTERCATVHHDCINVSLIFLIDACVSNALQVPAALAGRAARLSAARRAYVTHRAEDDEEEEERLRNEVVRLATEFDDAATATPTVAATSAVRTPNAVRSTRAPARPSAVGAGSPFSAGGGGGGQVLGLILDAIRVLAEVNAQAVSLLCACVTHADISRLASKLRSGMERRRVRRSKRRVLSVGGWLGERMGRLRCACAGRALRVGFFIL